MKRFRTSITARYLGLLGVFLALAFLFSSYRSPWKPTPYRYNLPELLPPLKEPPDNSATVEGVRLGRLLFYDSLLSGPNTQSCGSCHQQQYAFTDGGKRFSKGANGHLGKRNAMSLVNLGWGTFFFWDGRAATLEELVLQPIQDTTEMAQPLPELLRELRRHPHYPRLFAEAFGDSAITSERISKAIAQFLRTLISVKNGLNDFLKTSPAEFRLRFPEAGVPASTTDLTDYLYGRKAVLLCLECHGGAFYGGYTMRNNGINGDAPEPGAQKYTRQEADLGRFKAPGLLNVSRTAPYMHDGRFQTLEQVVAHYSGPVSHAVNVDSTFLKPENQLDKQGLSASDRWLILEVLRSLEDTTYLRNPAYSDPFRNPEFDWEKVGR